MSIAPFSTLLNYILYGYVCTFDNISDADGMLLGDDKQRLFIPSLDNVYLPSWQVNVALFVVFGCASALGFAILRYRCGEADLVTAFWEQVKWTVGRNDLMQVRMS